MRPIYLIMLLMFSMLAGCDEDFSPLVSVEVTDQGLNTVLPHTKTWKLKQAQLKQLDLWLREHNSEGNMLLLTPPRSSLLIILTHANGSRSSLELFSSAKEGWKDKVLVSASGNPRIKSISPEEREMLLQLVQDVPDINLAPGFTP